RVGSDLAGDGTKWHEWHETADEGPAMNARFPCLTTEQLAAVPTDKRWIWDGYLARGKIALLTSMWKSGKTTLLAHLLAQRKRGAAFAGRPTAAGASAVVTEEADAVWAERNARLGFGAGDHFFCRPFVGPPSHADWNEFIDYLIGLSRGGGF